MRWRRGWALAAVLLSSAGLLSQDRSFEPVPPESLRGRTLLLDAYNRTVDAPGEGWVWLRSAPASRESRDGDSRRYYAVHPERPAAFLFYVLDDEAWRKPPTRSYMARLRERFKRELRAAGSELADFRFSPSHIPVNNGYRFSYRINDDDGPPTFVHGYVGGAWVKYIFLVKSRSASEPRLFAQFADSCELLNRRRY